MSMFKKSRASVWWCYFCGRFTLAAKDLNSNVYCKRHKEFRSRRNWDRVQY